MDRDRLLSSPHYNLLHSRITIGVCLGFFFSLFEDDDDSTNIRTHSNAEVQQQPLSTTLPSYTEAMQTVPEEIPPSHDDPFEEEEEEVTSLGAAINNAELIEIELLPPSYDDPFEEEEEDAETTSLGDSINNAELFQIEQRRNLTLEFPPSYDYPFEEEQTLPPQAQLSYESLV